MKQFMVLILSLSFIIAWPVMAQGDISPKLNEQLDELEQTTITIRGLAAMSPVQRVFPDSETVLDFIMASYNEDMTAEKEKELMDFYSAFGFLEADFNLKAEIIDLLADQIGGYYDPEVETMNVLLFSSDELGDRLPLLERIIFVHEYTHALQDQHYNLQAILDQMQGESISGDEAIALQALVEGDATFVMNQYTIEETERNPLGTLTELLMSGLDAGSLALPAGIPDILGAELLMPYEGGAVFVAALYQAGGWEAVNEAYTNLPLSSEQIYHPQAYLDGDNPIDLSAEAVDQSARLGDDWTLLQADRFGFFYLREWLKQQLSGPAAELAAAGWGGDWYQIYSNGDEYAWLLRSEWDDAGAANEFLKGSLSFAASAYADGSQTGSCWQGEAMALCIQKHSAYRVELAQAPTVALAEALLKGE